MNIYLYHWTHRSNLPAILREGLDPKHARGKMRVVWACEESRIAWAVGHVATHHQCSPDDMVCLRVRVDWAKARKVSWPNVRVFDKRIAPSRIMSVMEGVGRGWVSRATALRHTARIGR